MIACIRTHVESIGSKWRCLRILTNIARHMESIHHASRQVWQSNKLLRIFGGSNSISKTIVKHMNNWGMSGYSISARIIRRGIQVTKNSKAVSSKDSRNNRENFGVSCNNKINWETLYEWRVYVVIHRSLSMKGNCKSDEHKFSGYQRRVSSGSSRAADDHQ